MPESTRKGPELSEVDLTWVAADYLCKPEVLDVLANHKSARVRIEVAGNEYAWTSTLVRLRETDQDPAVRARAAQTLSGLKSGTLIRKELAR